MSHRRNGEPMANSGCGVSGIPVAHRKAGDPVFQVKRGTPSRNSGFPGGMLVTGPPGFDPVLPLGAFCGIRDRDGWTAWVNRGPCDGFRTGAPLLPAVLPLAGGCGRVRAGW